MTAPRRMETTYPVPMNPNMPTRATSEEAANDGILNRSRSNIGDPARFSAMAKATRDTPARESAATIAGLLQPR
ncbi:hypothetical protein [Streptomyces sp. NPDC096132]|uniref:hypothetical protein n=1 Tax=Streptomyces sp. NPDC096132 TaxID=3366075 RepID=UPI00382F9796